ncbi:hypothetical protein T190_07670 [Sinorhizobium meliloti CCBAU 01290]|nr:hypothetical protein T190_07670 [Sinorhizobium meliloti CCBAU 01290]
MIRWRISKLLESLLGATFALGICNTILLRLLDRRTTGLQLVDVAHGVRPDPPPPIVRIRVIRFRIEFKFHPSL